MCAHIYYLIVLRIGVVSYLSMSGQLLQILAFQLHEIRMYSQGGRDSFMIISSFMFVFEIL